MSILFIIPVIVDIHSHRFEVYTLVSEIHENVDLVSGFKNIFESEGIINSQDVALASWIDLYHYSKEEIILKPKEQLVKVEAPFTYEISGLAIVNILDKPMQSTVMLKLKFTQNLVMLDITNSSSAMVILSLKEVIEKEKKDEVMDMLYKYKEGFSLTDEIGTCPNIEAEIDVTDK